jgi:hypothetical protein
VGDRGGNTIVEDSKRQDTGAQSQTVGDRLRKAYESYVDTLREERKQNTEQGMINILAKSIGAAMTSLQKAQPEIIVNVPEQPRPVVNVNVKMPKVLTEMQKVVRDAKGNIDYTTTTRTYEE